MTVVNPRPFLDGIAAAVADRAGPAVTRWDPPDAGSGSAGLSPAAPDPRAQAAQYGDSQPRGYFIGEWGHRVPLVGAGCYVGPCDECDPSVT
ncbi:MAG: hypothetical protein ACRDTA_00800 [Pseudonocardiaceae bacterium]